MAVMSVPAAPITVVKGSAVVTKVLRRSKAPTQGQVPALGRR